MEEVSIFVLSGLKSRLKTSWYIVIARSPANSIPYQNKGTENDILTRKTSQCHHSTSAKWSPRDPEEAVRQRCKRSSNDSNAHANLNTPKRGLIVQAKSTSIFYSFYFRRYRGRASRYQLSNLEAGSTKSHAIGLRQVSCLRSSLFSALLDEAYL